MHSPYRGTRPSRWPRVTQQLVERHPLSPQEIVDVVLLCWDSILASSIGTRGFRIGADIFPKPQIMGFFLHELMPLECDRFELRYATRLNRVVGLYFGLRA